MSSKICKATSQVHGRFKLTPFCFTNHTIRRRMPHPQPHYHFHTIDARMVSKRRVFARGLAFCPSVRLTVPTRCLGQRTTYCQYSYLCRGLCCFGSTCYKILCIKLSCFSIKQKKDSTVSLFTWKSQKLLLLLN